MTFHPDSLPYLNPLLDRRVALVTGGNSGLGWFTVLHLYLHGYVVYIAGRSVSRVEKAIKEIKGEAETRISLYSGEERKTRYIGELKFLEIDLLDLNSVELAVKIFQSFEGYLNLLVNNAGVMALPYSLTKDNFEIQVQTNYVAPFLFTQRLIPLLNQPHVKDPRIINLSSIGHYFELFYVDMSSKFNYYPNIVFTWFRYGMAKTAGIHHMKMLALKHPNILCVAVHPGFVMNTNLFSYWTRLPLIGILFWVSFQIFGWFFGVTNETGSFATLRCGLDDGLKPERDNGKYYVTDGIETMPSRVASNLDYAARTWIWSVHELRDRGIDISDH